MWNEDEDGALRLVGFGRCTERPGRSEAWQLGADTLMVRRSGEVVEARDGTLSGFESPSVPVGGGGCGEVCGAGQDGYGGGYYGFRPYHLS
jgi:hypothetical protein